MSAADPAPDAPPDEPRPTPLLDRFGAALPIALAGIATALAGLSTTEMTQAMLWRAAAAQDQAKAGNQWSLAGFKRDRSLIVQTAAAQLAATAGGPRPAFAASAGAPDEEKTAADWLAGKGPQRADLPKVEDEKIDKLLKAVRGEPGKPRPSEADVLRQAREVRPEAINGAVDAAEAAVRKVEDDWDKPAKAAGKLAAGGGPAAQAALFEMEQRRYRAEATLNFGLGYLYEARVKVSTAESDRHKDRSKNFFYAMLAAQLGATVASLGLAKKKRSAFWGLAGAAGLIAVGFGAWVYVTM